jgi:hypothetical protein
MAMHHGNTSLKTGARVLTADGKELGKVKAVREDQFKVDVRFAPDYWLGRETIEEITPEAVQLKIEKTEVGSAKVPDLKNIDNSSLPSGQGSL